MDRLEPARAPVVGIGLGGDKLVVIEHAVAHIVEPEARKIHPVDRIHGNRVDPWTHFHIRRKQ